MEKIIQVIEGVEIKKQGKELIFSKDGKESKRQFFHPLIDFIVAKNEVKIVSKKEGKNMKKLINSYSAHITNLIQGIVKPYVYKLKICGSHFPITVKVEGKTVLISNYLGEKVPRKCKIVGDSKVSIQGDIITVESANKEYAGMTAGIIEKAGQVKGHDNRIFQDGIFMIEKAGNQI